MAAEFGATNPSGSFREVLRVVRGVPTSDGAGVKLRRVIGQPALPDLDPFLLLDEFGTDRPGDYIAGFPEHPHRGFETVTYMLDGCMRHQDNHGHEGVLVPGSVQWMTAGRGIVHSEMPQQQSGLMRGFQLWLNLPAGDKMTAPKYQEFNAERIPVAKVAQGVEVKVIAGRVGDVLGPISQPATDPTYLDVALKDGAGYQHTVPTGHAAFLYVYEGTVRVGGEKGTVVKTGELAVLSEATDIRLTGVDAGAVSADTAGVSSVATRAAGEGRSRAIMVAGRPLREPVVRHGPFVMNTREQILEAIRDFQSGRF